MPDVAFLFKRGRRERLESAEEFPSEFFYGYVQLAEVGTPVTFLDEDDLDVVGPINLVWRLLSALSHTVAGVHLWAVWKLARRANRDRLNSFGVLVATTNTFGLSLALLKRLGLLGPCVVFIAMGVGDLVTHPVRRWAINWLLGPVQTVVISRGEAEYLNKRLGRDAQVAYMPFGVDDRFWTPGPAAPAKSRPYVLSIGNDRHRDYATLIAAWRPEFPALKIVTSQILASTANIEVISGDWRQQLLSDSQVRQLFREAMFVILPIRETVQPSGQSACLQAMACAKTVVISDIQGLWDRALMRHGETCVLVPPGSAEQMSSSIEHLLANPAMQARIGSAANQVVEDFLNVGAMATQLSGYFAGR